MKLPNFLRLNKNDYEEDKRDFVDKLAFSINDNFESLFDALNKRVTLKDNIAGTIKDIEVTVDANGFPSDSSNKVQLDNNNKLEGVIVLSAVNLTNVVIYPTGAPFISFTQSGNIITINNITGLQANNKYRLRIVAFSQ